MMSHRHVVPSRLNHAFHERLNFLLQQANMETNFLISQLKRGIHKGNRRARRVDNAEILGPGRRAAVSGLGASSERVSIFHTAAWPWPSVAMTERAPRSSVGPNGWQSLPWADILTGCQR